MSPNGFTPTRNGATFAEVGFQLSIKSCFNVSAIWSEKVETWSGPSRVSTMMDDQVLQR
jgi:hypothetical protein